MDHKLILNLKSVSWPVIFIFYAESCRDETRYREALLHMVIKFLKICTLGILYDSGDKNGLLYVSSPTTPRS